MIFSLYRDGKADYIWTRPIDGAMFVWFNNFPNQPAWLSQGNLASGVGVSGQNVRYADLQGTGRSSYIAIDPSTNAISAWLNGCDKRGLPPMHCHEQRTVGKIRFGFNIDALHFPWDCKDLSDDFWLCMENNWCAPNSKTFDCNHNNKQGFSGSFDTSLTCQAKTVSRCFWENMGADLSCHS